MADICGKVEDTPAARHICFHPVETHDGQHRCSCGYEWGGETKSAHPIDILRQHHWLVVDFDQPEPRITGCHCGFVERDEERYGDDTVKHLMLVGMNADTSLVPKAQLGFATTRQLFEELMARVEVDHASGGGGLDYRTVDNG